MPWTRWSVYDVLPHTVQRCLHQKWVWNTECPQELWINTTIMYTNVVAFSTNANNISYARILVSRLALHCTNLTLVFMHQRDHSALWCITECKTLDATWLQVFPLLCIHIRNSSRRSSWANFPSARSWTALYSLVFCIQAHLSVHGVTASFFFFF